MGGVYIEPGTYSNMMYVFLFLYFILKKEKIDLLVFAGSLSIILTYSAWGIIFGSYLMIILILGKLNKFSWKKRILYSILILLF